MVAPATVATHLLGSTGGPFDPYGFDRGDRALRKVSRGPPRPGPGDRRPEDRVVTHRGRADGTRRRHGRERLRKPGSGKEPELLEIVLAPTDGPAGGTEDREDRADDQQDDPQDPQQ